MYSSSQENPQHMYSFGLNKSYTGMSRDSSSGGSTSSSTATPTRRRSHRPRGCRGGRKNRKNREAKAAAAAAHSNNGGVLAPSTKTQTTNSGGAQQSPAKGDLSHFQHVNTTGRAWGKQPDTKGHSPLKRQMLPPPLPPFVGGHDPFLQEDPNQQQNANRNLKMLPSFDEPEAKTFLSAPISSMGLLTTPSQQPLDLTSLFCGSSDVMTIGTLVSTSSSGSEDDFLCNTNHKNERIEMQRQQELESGSLFVTSPRSFLLGSSETGSDVEAKISVW